MRVLVVSDVHGNIDALERLDDWRASQKPLDAIWVLGDLVDYGGDPGAVIDWARTHASVVIRGNHDHAMATGESCGSSSVFLDLSVTTREYFKSRLSADALNYLGHLPLTTQITIADGSTAFLVHACPSDPLFGYVPRDADAIWRQNGVAAGDPAFLLVGHTHDQFARTIGPTIILNPGSLGLPTDGDVRAAFAVIEDGVVAFHRIEYDLSLARARVAALDIDPHVRQRLDLLLRDARVPPL